ERPRAGSKDEGSSGCFGCLGSIGSIVVALEASAPRDFFWAAGLGHVASPTTPLGAVRAACSENRLDGRSRESPAAKKIAAQCTGLDRQHDGSVLFQLNPKHPDK